MAPAEPPAETLPLGGEGVSRAIEDALLRRKVLSLDYVDRKGR